MDTSETILQFLLILFFKKIDFLHIYRKADQLGRSLWTLDHVHAQPQSMPAE